MPFNSSRLLSLPGLKHFELGAFPGRFSPFRLPPSSSSQIPHSSALAGLRPAAAAHTKSLGPMSHGDPHPFDPATYCLGADAIRPVRQQLLAKAVGSNSGANSSSSSRTQGGVESGGIPEAETEAEVLAGEGQDGSGVGASGERKVLLIDVMDTLIADPFHFHIPNFFGLSMKELIAQKHPTAWVDFEKGYLTEEQLKSIFFSDGRDFDIQGLKRTMQEAYVWIQGMEELLGALRDKNVEVHAFTNYPAWYQLIEEKLKLSRYLHWTFVSCHTGTRKPELAAYEHAAAHLQVDPSQCIFVDDRKANVLAAEAAGMKGLHFTSAAQLSKDLQSFFPDVPLKSTAT